MGEAFAGKTLGKKAMVWGLIAQSVPDIDFIAATWLNTTSSLLAHRGFTHSIFFAIAVALIMATLANRWHRPHNISFTRWLLFFSAVVLGHIFIDAFNNYGVGWFEPFSHYRISFNAIYVADPFFSVAPGIACIMLLLLKQKTLKRKFWWKFGLYISAAYLVYCIVNKTIIDSDVKKEFIAQHIPHEKYFTTPAPLQNWLWFIVTGDDSNYYVGYRSVFDRAKSLSLTKFPRNIFLLDSLKSHKDVQQLIRFSQGFYTVEKKQDTLMFNDLRFGQIIGWQHPNEEFVFHYYLHPDIDNTLVVQRGRFAKWNASTITSMFDHIKGK